LGTALSDIQPLSEIIGVPGVDAAAVEIGQLIRRARVANGMTQIDLANAVGIAQSALSNIELGKGSTGPSYRLLREFANALGKPFMSFFTRREHPDVITVTGALEGISKCTASVEGFIGALLDQTELIDVCSQLRAAEAGSSHQIINIAESYQPTMCRVLPHTHTRLETHGVTVFVTINGELEIKSAQTLGSFDKGCIVGANETVEVANPGLQPTSFLSVPAKWFLAAADQCRV